MKDPFVLQPVPWLSNLVQPWCDSLNLTTLPLHVHEIIASALLYTVVFWPISPIVSKILAPEHYGKLSRKKRLNWDAHVVSMVQSCLINALAIWVIWADDERRAMSWEERVWGYTGASAMVQAMAAGYFVWDLFVTSFNLDVFGLGTLAHAVAALLVYSLGFRPLVNYYGCVFILWELSTPFLNIHWFMDKVGMTGSRAQLYNGVLLLATFGICRLVVGTWQSYLVMKDLLLAVNASPTSEKEGLATMMYADAHTTAPWWAAGAYLLSNLTLNGLNFYWYFAMIRAVRKRFEPTREHGLVTEADLDLATVGTGVAQKQQARRRKA